jgi:2-iminobutanoate/2-iminopropanoate deaminase
MKQEVKTQNAPAPIGPYSQAILSGNTLYLSGQIALDPKSGELNTKTIVDETHQVMRNIQAIITAGGMEMSNIVKCSIFISDMDNFTEINNIYGSYFEGIAPARETVEVSRLPKDVNVEISVIAVK